MSSGQKPLSSHNNSRVFLPFPTDFHLFCPTTQVLLRSFDPMGALMGKPTFLSISTLPDQVGSFIALPQTFFSASFESAHGLSAISRGTYSDTVTSIPEQPRDNPCLRGQSQMYLIGNEHIDIESDYFSALI